MKVIHIGYARKSRNGRALKLDIMLDAFLSARRYRGGDGKEYVNVVVNMEKLIAVLEGRKTVTGVNQLDDGLDRGD